jgi:hypothetical protein
MTGDARGVGVIPEMDPDYSAGEAELQIVEH